MKKQYPIYVYSSNKKATGTCVSCKTVFDKVEQVTDKKGRSHVKRKLTVLEEQTNWFRGDDEVVGVVCEDCKKTRTLQEIGNSI